MADYATLAQVKAALRITDTVDDTLLSTTITAASLTVRNGLTATTRLRTGTRWTRIRIIVCGGSRWR